jgi:hypothetical protein
MDTVIIPQQYSKYGVYTSFFVLLNAIVAFAYKDYVLATLLSTLFLTSVSNWSKVYLMSYVKMVDIFIAISTISYITFCNHFNPFWRKMWNTVICIAIVIFIYNSLVFYEIVLIQKRGNREVYIGHVFLHLAFLHIAPTVVCMLALMN